MITSHTEALRRWVEAQWPNVGIKLGIPHVTHAPAWQPLSGDAGFRQYFRLACEPSVLAVYAPPATEDGPAFLAVANALRNAGVFTPQIWASDLHEGFFLIEDLGETLMLAKLNEASADALYGRAMAALLRIQATPVDPIIFPHYDQVHLREEMDLFPDWFCGQLLGITLDRDTVSMLNQTFELLENRALEQPQVVVHRDYHSRNLVCSSEEALGVIDFQDAVIGPITYDLVSLLRDCYIAWPEDLVQRWVADYHARLRDAGDINSSISLAQFEHWFDWMGLQRHIKVLGIFARLSLRDGKHAYLKDLPLVIHYTLSVAKRYDMLHPFCDWFEVVLRTKIKKQPWFSA